VNKDPVDPEGAESRYQLAPCPPAAPTPPVHQLHLPPCPLGGHQVTLLLL
jgi:hypothetical protein